MAKTGPKPKPLTARAIEGGSAKRGTVSHRPLPARVDVAPTLAELGEERAPAGLPLEGKRLWRDVVVGLIRIGMITTVDRPAVIAMCHHYARMERAQRTLDEQGYYVAGSTGQMVAHPAIRILNDASSQFIRYAAEFGLTPSSRVGLGLADVARRTLQVDLEEKLGYNPRRT